MPTVTSFVVFSNTSNSVFGRFSLGFFNLLEQAHATNHQEDGNSQKQPGNELMRGEWVYLPIGKIKYHQRQNAFPRKESVGAMRVRTEQGFPGNIDKKTEPIAKTKYRIIQCCSCCKCYRCCIESNAPLMLLAAVVF